MEEKSHVILSVETYEKLLNYLSTTQVYNNVAQLISESVNDANANTQRFTITDNMASKIPGNVEPEMQVVDNEKDNTQEASQ